MGNMSPRKWDTLNDLLNQGKTWEEAFVILDVPVERIPKVKAQYEECEKVIKKAMKNAVSFEGFQEPL